LSLDRKDIRAMLDPDMHEALAVLADVDGTDIGEFIERLLIEVIQTRLHEASEIHGRAGHLGKTGITRELPGIPSRRPRR
jgi:hypothetical protein